MLAQARCRPSNGEELGRRLEGRARHAHLACIIKVAQGDEVVPLRQLLVLDELGGGVQDRARQADRLALHHEFAPAATGEELADRLGEAVEDVAADEDVLERRVRELGRIVEHPEERLPVTRLVRGDVERPVLALPGTRRRVADHQYAILRHAHDVVAVEREVAGDGHFVRRDVDGLAADRGAVLQRGEDAHRGVRARFVPMLLCGNGERWAFRRSDLVHRTARRVAPRSAWLADAGTDP